MRSLLVGAVLLATVASSATAQVVVTPTNGAPDPFEEGWNGQTNVLNFTNCIDGVATSLPTDITITGGACKSGNESGLWAEPPGSFSGAPYYTTMGPYATTSTVVIDFSEWLDLNTFTVLSVSLYWGSIDNYNWLDVLNSEDQVLWTVWGGDLTSELGNQTLPESNRRVNLAFNDDVSGSFAKLQFRSTQAAFEFDDIAMELVSPTQTSTVPEPATVSLVALALGALGVVGARRKRNTGPIA